MSDTFIHGHALLIGVGADLPGTVHDASALHALLINPQRAAYPPAQVDLLTEASADRVGILTAFERLIERTQSTPEATVIVYFSGHGGRYERAGAQPEYFLVPYGYQAAQRSTTAISGREFTACIEAISARKLVVLLDCCHAAGMPALKDSSEVFSKAPVPPELLHALDSGSGRVVVASSYEHELSYAGTPYSVFTACLLEALDGRAATVQDGYVRILDVLSYLFKHVPERTTGPQYTAGVQHPFVKKILDLGDNFPLCSYAGGSKIPSDMPDSGQQYTSPGNLTAGQRLRLQQRIDMLQQEWNVRRAKITRLRAAVAIEAGVAVQFQLEQQLLQEEAVLSRLEAELAALEQS